MKKIKLVCLTVLLSVVVTYSSAQAGNKWLDYGNGMVNLSQVTHIHPTSTFNTCNIKFDNFTLTLCNSGLPTNLYDKKTNRLNEDIAAELETNNKEILNDTIKEIIDFLDSSDTYRVL
ncbi:MAG: hypothetical protein OCC45_08580 [Desulfotalea sp.]